MSRTDPSPREQEVLDLVMQGKGATHVARALYLSSHTADHHILALRTRYGASTAHELCALAWRRKYAALEREVVELRRLKAIFDRRGRPEVRGHDGQ